GIFPSSQDASELARADRARQPRRSCGRPCWDRTDLIDQGGGALSRRVRGARASTRVTRLPAPAKINLALVVGPHRGDGKHEVATVLQRIDLADRVTIERTAGLHVEGFAGDTLVHRALELLADAAGVEPGWSARIDKRIPVAAGLGGGSSDAATALRLANETLAKPLPPRELHALASSLGAD